MAALFFRDHEISGLRPTAAPSPVSRLGGPGKDLSTSNPVGDHVPGLLTAAIVSCTVLVAELPDNSGLASLVPGRRYHRAGAVFTGASSPLRCLDESVDRGYGQYPCAGVSQLAGNTAADGHRSGWHRDVEPGPRQLNGEARVG
jgi:hypothetical protein